MATDVIARGAAARASASAIGGQRFELVTKTAEYFGIRPGSGNQAGFARISDFVANLPPSQRGDIQLPPGDFSMATFAISKGSQRYRNGFRLRGAGRALTRLIPEPSSEPVFISIEADFTEVSLMDLFICGHDAVNAVINPGQYPLIALPAYDAVRRSGGMSFGQWPIKVDGWDRPVVWKGSQLLGPGNGGANAGGNRVPNQFLDVNTAEFNTRYAQSGRPAFYSIGQLGQLDMMNTQFHKNNPGETGPAAYIGIDHRIHSIALSAANTADGKFQASNPLLPPGGTPVRLIGTDLPTCNPPLNKGQTYFLYPSQMQAAIGQHDMVRFRLATSPQQAAAGNYLAITASGTPANFKFVQVFFTSLVAGEFTTEEPHLYITSDEVQLVGANLPTGLSVGTPYFIIRTGHKTFRLASSYDNAIAGTALSADGGTLSDFGLVTYGDTYGLWQQLGKPYTVFMFNVTSELSETGIHFNGASDTHVWYHSEQQRIGLVFGPGCSVNLYGSSWTGDGAKNGAGTGVAFIAYGQGCRVTMTGKHAFDNGGAELIYHRSHSAQVNSRNATLSGGKTSDKVARTTGGTWPLSAAASMDIGEMPDFTINPVAGVTIATLLSNHLPGAQVAFGVNFGGDGFVTLSNSDNIMLGGVASMRFPTGSSGVLELMDHPTTRWRLIGDSVFGIARFRTYVANGNITVDPTLGDPEVTLAAACTVQAPSVTALPTGHRITFRFTQDATGGRVLSWAAAWKGAPAMGSAGSAGQKARFTYEWDGSAYVLIGSTSWYT